ncbi:hypothetical protein [Deinococcus sp. UR1]|uniref:hypothetical protein n=1 Tax=Deinococcus sp. UR1 TaxID=1704277 RepID=UPI000C184F24|nr:hypothetical protein [Deinococcus sp. UR1]PIG95914.1 hypothetical protein AMD26_019050 [Deinococcus sp. UR1]
MSSRPPAEDDESGEGQGKPSPSTITFTQYHATLATDFTLHAQPPEVTRTVLTRSAWQVSPLPDRPPPRLQVQRLAWQLTWHAPGSLLAQQHWTVDGLTRSLVRALRRHGWASTAQLERHAYVLSPPVQSLKDFLEYHWPVFVQYAPDAWTLTPWVRLDVPFTPTSGSYGRDATRFWIECGHIPAPHEEWHPAVRAAVTDHLNLAPLPPYFQPVRVGWFQQDRSSGGQPLALNINALPEGLYWTREGVTFSISGRALFREDARGPVVVTGLLERYFREALLFPDTMTWHPTGAAFLAACRASQITVIGRR